MRTIYKKIVLKGEVNRNSLSNKMSLRSGPHEGSDFLNPLSCEHIKNIHVFVNLLLNYQFFYLFCVYVCVQVPMEARDIRSLGTGVIDI